MTFDFVNYQFKPKRKDTPPYGHLIFLKKQKYPAAFFLCQFFFSRQGSEFFLCVEQQIKTRALCLSPIFCVSVSIKLKSFLPLIFFLKRKKQNVEIRLLSSVPHFLLAIISLFSKSPECSCPLVCRLNFFFAKQIFRRVTCRLYMQMIPTLLFLLLILNTHTHNGL
jgi:hypothetical protein